nr:MAG TPA: hypothetical protein [Caudoviricetes sp.]
MFCVSEGLSIVTESTWIMVGQNILAIPIMKLFLIILRIIRLVVFFTRVISWVCKDNKQTLNNANFLKQFTLMVNKY